MDDVVSQSPSFFAFALLVYSIYNIEATTMISPYYSKAVWGAFSGIAALYSTVTHVALGCLHPFGVRLQNTLPSMPQLPEANNRVAIVTGSNTGIGLETTKALVERGFTVIMACRSRDKAEAAIDSISASGKAVFVHPLDLSSIESVKDFSKAVAEKYKHVDVLINNAGRNTSGQGEGDLDLCFQTNFLGHFVLTQELLPLLLKAKKGRIVNLASVMHHYCRDAEVHNYEYWKSCTIPNQHPPILRPNWQHSCLQWLCDNNILNYPRLLSIQAASIPIFGEVFLGSSFQFFELSF